MASKFKCKETSGLEAFCEPRTPKYSEGLQGDALYKFCNAATKLHEHFFALTGYNNRSIEEDEELFKCNNNTMTLLNCLRQHLKSYSIDSIFKILCIDPLFGIIDTSEPSLSLLQHGCIIVYLISGQLHDSQAPQQLLLPQCCWHMLSPSWTLNLKNKSDP